MKNLLSTLFLLVFLGNFNLQAQDCIDPEQIDFNVFCLTVYDPVCGCDGVTYSNECVAFYHNGVTSWVPGECETEGCIDPEQIDLNVICTFIYDPVCGCDGVTYSNECVAYNHYGVTSWTAGECAEVGPCSDLAGADFGLCEMVLGYGQINGVCTVISGCSTVDNNSGLDMAAAIYPSPMACEVACGNNDCLDLAGADFGGCEAELGYAWIDGECILISGCSTVDLNTEIDYADYIYETAIECEVACGADCIDLSGADFGLCDLPLGIGLVNGDCVSISGCSTIDNNSGLDLADYFYENMEDCEACQQSCIDLEVIDPNTACFDIYEPVCGCDGVTYSNECYAYYYNGVTSWTEGECGAQQECVDLQGADFGDCEMIVGIGLIDGECVGISGCGTVNLNTNEDLAEYFFEDLETCQTTCEQLCLDVTSIDFGPCDFVLGIAIYNGECQSVSGCDYTVDEVDYSGAFFDSLEDCEAACTTTIPELDRSDVNVYPVPFQNELGVQFDRAVSMEWQILDIAGRVVLEGDLKHSDQLFINTGSVTRGNYILKLSNSEVQVVKRIVKE